MYETLIFSGFMFRLSFGADVLLPNKIAVSSDNNKTDNNKTTFVRCE